MEKHVCSGKMLGTINLRVQSPELLSFARNKYISVAKA